MHALSLSHLLHLLQVVVPAGAPWWLALLGTVVPIVSGWLSNLIMDGVRQLSAKLDTANVVVKQMAAVFIAMGVGFVTAHIAGVTLDPDLNHWTSDGINAVLTALAQQGIFRWKAANQASKAGLVYAARHRGA